MNILDVAGKVVQMLLEGGGGRGRGKNTLPDVGKC